MQQLALKRLSEESTIVNRYNRTCVKQIKVKQLSATIVNAKFVVWLMVCFGLITGSHVVAKTHGAGSHASAENSAPYKGLVVSNQPLYLLARAATKGIESPRKIMANSNIGHHHQLTPSNRKTIQDAEFIFWFGDTLETTLSKSLKIKPNAMALLGIKNLKPLNKRDTKMHDVTGYDPHIWLDPKKAKAIVRVIAAVRSLHHPEFKAQYKANSDAFADDMNKAIRYTKRLRSKETLHYVAYHDAYQYLENALNVKAMGSVVLEPELPATPKHLLWLSAQRKNKAQHKASHDSQPLCVLTENAHVADKLRLLNPVKVHVIDESMTDALSFVQGWQDIALSALECVD